MVVYKEESGITMEIANLPDVSGRCSALKSYTYEDGEVTAAMPGETNIYSLFHLRTTIKKNEIIINPYLSWFIKYVINSMLSCSIKHLLMYFILL